jgi:ABC-type sugar transport system substrate-binding protein
LERNRVFLSLSDESQEFQRGQARDAQRMGRELNIDVEVMFAANSARIQGDHIREVVQRPPDRQPTAIVIQPVAGDGDEFVELARAAAGKGTGWISLNRRAQYMMTLRREYPHLAIGSVSSDQLEIGRLQGRQLLARLKVPRARVLCVQGPPDTSAAQDRLQGTREALRVGKIEVELELTHADWSEAGGERATAEALRPPPAWQMWRHALRPDALICQNDQMAIGARRAAQAAGFQLPTVGVDGLAAGGQRLVNEGQFAATVIVVPNAGTAVHLVARHLWEHHPLPPEILVSPLSDPNLTALAAAP